MKINIIPKGLHYRRMTQYGFFFVVVLIFASFSSFFSSSWCTKASIVIIYCYLAPLRHSIAIHSTMPSNSHLPVSACMCWNCSYVSPYLTLSFLKSVSVSRQGELYVLSEAGSRFAHLPRTCNRKQVIITRLSKNHHRVLSRLCEECEGAGDVSHVIFCVCVCALSLS